MAEVSARRRRGRPEIGPEVRAPLPPAMHAELLQRAQRRGRPKAEVVREAIARYLAVPDDHPVQDPMTTEGQAA